jgi:hypothetical protein
MSKKAWQVHYINFDNADNRIVEFSTAQVCDHFEKRFETEAKTCVWCRENPKECKCTVEEWSQICPEQWAVDCYCRTNWLFDVVHVHVVKPHDPEEKRHVKVDIPKEYITDMANFSFTGRPYTRAMHEERLKGVHLGYRK